MTRKLEASSVSWMDLMRMCQTLGDTHCPPTFLWHLRWGIPKNINVTMSNVILLIVWKRILSRHWFLITKWSTYLNILLHIHCWCFFCNTLHIFRFKRSQIHGIIVSTKVVAAMLFAWCNPSILNSLSCSRFCYLNISGSFPIVLTMLNPIISDKFVGISQGLKPEPLCFSQMCYPLHHRWWFKTYI